MKLPKQTAPIQRKVSGTTLSLHNGVNGVEASATLEEYVELAKAARPLVDPLLKSSKKLLSKTFRSLF
ncbi:hypothetical protein [Moorena sp. SIO3H5]|uniref:hypothetical protein n=1 Tax=Moorena sp. SIO3H5 TaxID=2607834 RepID=UPI0013BCB849|nr:hypothetical protein [Moorena sp. SIO3H5]NEO73041.1 hypothetical protein [Moorena sp. SIO3H5]